MKLGRLEAKFDSAVPKLGNVLKAPAPLPATELRYRNIHYWPMLLNDSLGDCTIASIGHVFEFWRNIAGIPIVMTDPEAEVHYSAVGGYVPGNAATDKGCVELDVLKYFSTVKMIGSAPSQLTKFIAIPSMAIEDVKYAVHVLGNCYIGVNLPNSAMTFNTWDVVKGSKIEGGHCINIVGYDDPNSLLFVVSWGQAIGMTYNFFKTYIVEAWSLYSPDWIQQNGVNMSNFDHATVLNS